MSIPNSINYRNVKPIGVPSKIKKVIFYPQNLYSEIKPNDLVRFHIKAPTFWDPYNTFIKLKVSFEDLPVGHIVQIDGSAHSFINEMIISAGTTELERISEYDVLASILNDCAYTSSARLGKQHEGLSSETLKTNHYPSYENSSQTTITTATSQLFGTFGYRPTIKNSGSTYWKETALANLSGAASTEDLGTCKNPVNLIRAGKSDAHMQRADENFISTKRKGHPGPYEPIRSLPYNIAAPNWATTGFGTTYFDTPRTIGPTVVFSNEYSVGCFEDTFSKHATEFVVKNGKVSNPEIVPRTSAEYCMPLLSGLMGILMPKDQYKLFPAFALDNLTIEFRINPHAVFTSGYQSGGVGALQYTSAQSTQMTRTFKIIEFELIVDLVQFDDSVTDLMRQQLSGDGIVISTHSWALGPLYNIASTAGVLGTWQVNMGFESLKSIFLTFLSNDYLTYSFCRKLYKYSRNITSIQTKIGLEYFPEQQLMGHGGNPYALTKNDENNWIYIYELHKLFGTLNDTLSGSIINRHNFCINERPYDITNMLAYCPVDSFKENNIDTAVGFPLIHENRMVGRGFYTINLSFNSDSTMLNGVNTIQNRPFDISLKADGINVNPLYDRPCTMMMLCNYDFVVQISSSGVRVLGRA